MRSILIVAFILVPSLVNAEDYVTAFVNSNPTKADSHVMSLVNESDWGDKIVNVYNETSEIYVAGRYWMVKEQDFPCLIVHRDTGNYYFKVSGDAVFKFSSENLIEAVNRADERDKKVHDEDYEPSEQDYQGWLRDRWRNRRNPDAPPPERWTPVKNLANLFGNFFKAIMAMFGLCCFMLLLWTFKAGMGK